MESSFLVSNGSRSAGRLSLTNLPPTIGNFLGEKPELVVARRNLPIYSHRQKILDAISLHRVIMVAGDPGSGKTSQVLFFFFHFNALLSFPQIFIVFLAQTKANRL